MALNFSTLTKPVNPQVVDPVTGKMREEWQLYFDGLTSQLNSSVDALSTDPAPIDAEYVTASANGTLTAERVVTDTATVTKDVSVAGQIKLNVPNDAITFAKIQNITTDRLLGRDTAGTADAEEISVGGGLEFTGGPGIQRSALTGDVTASAGSNATTIAADAVTNAKMANMAAWTLKARNNSSSGDAQDVALADIAEVGTIADTDELIGFATGGAIQKTLVSKIGVPSIAREWTKTQNFDRTTLTDAANISWDLASNQVAKVTLGGNRTLDNPTNMVDGATYVLDIIQDGAGTRTLAFDTKYYFPGGSVPTLSTGANAVDVLCCESDGSVMRCNLAKNFAKQPPLGSFLQQTNSTGAATQFTFAAQNLGAAHAERVIVCAVTADTTPASISSATINGVAATVDVTLASVAEFAAIISAPVPTGTSGNVVINFNVNATDCSIALYRFVGLNSQTPTATTTDTADPTASTINVSANGFVVGCASFDNDTTAVTTVGVTETYDLDIGSSRSVGGWNANGSVALVGLTVSFDGGATNAAGVWAAYR